MYNVRNVDVSINVPSEYISIYCDILTNYGENYMCLLKQSKARYFNKNTNNEIKSLNQVFMMHRISLLQIRSNSDHHSFKAASVIPCQCLAQYSTSKSGHAFWSRKWISKWIEIIIFSSISFLNDQKWKYLQMAMLGMRPFVDIEFNLTSVARADWRRAVAF